MSKTRNLSLAEKMIRLNMISPNTDFEEGYVKGLQAAINELNSLPEQSGYWINDGYYGDNHPQIAYRCSNCDEQYIGYPGEFKYCPNCGMKMVNKDG